MTNKDDRNVSTFRYPDWEINPETASPDSSPETRPGHRIYLHRGEPRRGKTTHLLQYTEGQGGPTIAIIPTVGSHDRFYNPHTNKNEKSAALDLEDKIRGHDLDHTILQYHGLTRCPHLEPFRDDEEEYPYRVLRNLHEQACPGLPDDENLPEKWKSGPIRLQDYAKIAKEGLCPVGVVGRRIENGLEPDALLVVTPQKWNHVCDDVLDKVPPDTLVFADEFHDLAAYTQIRKLTYDVGILQALYQDFISADFEEKAPDSWDKAMWQAVMSVVVGSIHGPDLFDDVFVDGQNSWAFEKGLRELLGSEDREVLKAVEDIKNRITSEVGEVEAFYTVRDDDVFEELTLILADEDAGTRGATCTRASIREAVSYLEEVYTEWRDAYGPKDVHAAWEFSRAYHPGLDRDDWRNVAERLEAWLDEVVSTSEAAADWTEEQTRAIELVEFTLRLIRYEARLITVPRQAPHSDAAEASEVELHAVRGVYEETEEGLEFRPRFTSLESVKDAGLELHLVSATPLPPRYLDWIGLPVDEVVEGDALRDPLDFRIVCEVKPRGIHAWTNTHSDETKRDERERFSDRLRLLPEMLPRDVHAFARSNREREIIPKEAGTNLAEEHVMRSPESEAVELDPGSILLFTGPPQFPIDLRWQLLVGTRLLNLDDPGLDDPYWGAKAVRMRDAAVQTLQTSYRSATPNEENVAIVLSCSRDFVHWLRMMKNALGYENVDVTAVDPAGQRDAPVRQIAEATGLDIKEPRWKRDAKEEIYDRLLGADEVYATTVKEDWTIEVERDGEVYEVSESEAGEVLNLLEEEGRIAREAYHPIEIVDDGA